MILLAKKLVGKSLSNNLTLNAMDIIVHRNFFGSQLGSFISPLTLKKDTTTGEHKGVFIRAPIVTECDHPDVVVLATVSHEAVTSAHSNSAEGSHDFSEVIVAVQQGNFLATAFHPELNQDPYWHKLFLTFLD